MAVKVVIAPDKFKGSLSSFEVCDVIEKGLLLASSNFQIIKLPMADGGDGLSEIISYYTKAKEQKVNVSNPLFQTVDATYLVSEDGQTAFIEMAKASGLHLLHPSEYNPAKTTTYGTGELIKAAIESGAKEIIIGIGGSATNDGGIGMATALGYRFLDKNGNELTPVGEALIHLQKINAVQRIEFGDIKFKVACDVKNLLCGPKGASKIYGPQKGATPQMVEELEAGMMNYNAVIKRDLNIDISIIEGGGAAGGLGAGCVSFLDAEMLSGIELVMQYSNIEQHIQNADLIITGEGKLDEQTLQGKVVAGIAAIAKKYNKPVVALCGTKNITVDQMNELGIKAAFSIINGPMSLEDAIKDAAVLLGDASYNLGSVLL